MDYAQNLALPSYNLEQPGDTYYLTPLSVFCFGIVDQKLDKLTAYIYKESFAKKGGNNVSSLLMHYLEEKGWIPKHNVSGPIYPRKKLSVFMDNCSGQNKNHFVL